MATKAQVREDKLSSLLTSLKEVVNVNESDLSFKLSY